MVPSRHTSSNTAVSAPAWGTRAEWYFSEPARKPFVDMLPNAIYPQPLANFDAAQHASAQSPGHYNDPDMLIAGLSGFSDAQNRTHLSLWAISGAPLIAGNKPSSMTAATRAALTNREMIAIDQDALGRQGTKVAEDASGLQVYSKVLSGTGRRAVVLLNRTGSAATITARWSSLGLSGSATVRDVWAGAVFAAILFTIGKFLLGWYLGRGSTTSLYGAAGSLVVLLIWVYYSAQIFFFGAELTQVYANQRGNRIRPDEHAEARTN